MGSRTPHKQRGLIWFRRSLRYLWPQRRRLAVAVICSCAVALSFAASISAIVPVLRLMVGEDSPRSAVLRFAVSRQAHIDLVTYDPEEHPTLSPAPPIGSYYVRSVEPRAVWNQDLGPGDVIYLLSDPDDKWALLSALSREAPVTVALTTPDGVVHEVDLPAVQSSTLDRVAAAAANWAASWLPQDESIAARRHTLLIVMLGVLCMVIVSSVFRFFSEFMVIISSNRAVMDLRRHMYHTVMYLPITWFGKHLSETMSRVVTDFKDIERGYRAMFGKLTTEPIKAIVLLGCALVVDWRITGFALIAGCGGGVIVWVLGKKIRKANRKLLAGYAMMMSVLNATLSGMKIVRAHNNQTFERRRMWHAERQLLTQILRIGRWEAMTGPALEIMGGIVVVFGGLWLAGPVLEKTLKPDMFVLLVGFLVAMFDSIRKISAIFPRLAKADGAAQRVFEFMDRPIEKTAHTKPTLPLLKRQIRFENVTFTYPEGAAPALRDVSFTAQKDHKIALVGPNGSGKTTAMGLLDRFYSPDDGRILFDEFDVVDYSIASLRDQISLVTQDAVVFAVSVFDNIAYGLPNAPLDDVVEAAKRAHAHEFIEALPKGYDTLMGEFGATLSGGQRQRLALARAILRDAPIFIFDEATSQIDVESEQKIQEATRLFMTGRTSFVIAHRISTITDADHILVFDGGHIIDAGRHDELVKRCPLYRTLYTTHAGPQ